MSTKPWKELQHGKLAVKVFESDVELGRAAAMAAAKTVTSLLPQKEPVNLLFSTGASQFKFMDGLKEQAIPWDKIAGFHLDEYVGIPKDHPASFWLWLTTRVVNPFQPKVFHFIDGSASDVEAECRRYAKLIQENPIDLGFIGIGENGHVAFNDPPVADFNDPLMVKIIEPDEACRQQQVGEGWFPNVDAVPKQAITLTVPAIMACKEIISVVPDARKANAVRDALEGPITTACPASILRTHPKATLFLDKDSASKLAALA